ncbi:FAD-dependent oxidoreductase [candidate division FCPU426 bacterium]|nr:FAD-dependent oxidoreductase [candidate division FCPU426 bacterium]
MNQADPKGREKKVLLVGAGLANLYVLTHAQRFHCLQAAITLVDVNPFWLFSNMATEVAGGFYGLKDFHLDLRLLAKQHGAAFIQDEVVSLLPQQRKVMTKAGRLLEYDVVAFACGSLASTPKEDVPAEGVYPVKPVKNVLQIRNEIETCLELFPEKVLEVAVLGGGATGVEYALNISELLAERHLPQGWTCTLIEAKPGILPGFPKAAAAAAEKMLRVNDVKLRTGVKIQHIQSHRVVLEYGETLAFDLAVVALGERVADLFLQAGLGTDELGALRVEPTLQSGSYPEIFAGGNCARVKGGPAARTTQSTWQQAPVLLHNLLAALADKKQRRAFRPRKNRRFISLGKTNALLVDGPFVWQGPWVLQWKRWRDRRLMRRIRTYDA